MLRSALLALAGLASACYLDCSRPLDSQMTGRFLGALEEVGAAQANLAGVRRLLALAPDDRAAREVQLDEAFRAFDRARSEEHAVWVGRRLAYLGLYEAAVWWYRLRLNEFPASYRLHRHLGHRELTLRNLAFATRELERARELAAGQPDEVEPDGQPNALGIPTSTTQGNIDYHLALARYCSGQLEGAAEAWRRCLDVWATNDDSRVAAAHWLCTTLHRLGRHAEVAAVLTALPAAPEVIENQAYRDLIDLYAGRKVPDDVLGPAADPAQDAARAYGVARWLMDREEATGEERARGTAMLRDLAARGPWASFGRIAAESDLGDHGPTPYERAALWPAPR